MTPAEFIAGDHAAHPHLQSRFEVARATKVWMTNALCEVAVKASEYGDADAALLWYAKRLGYCEECRSEGTVRKMVSAWRGEQEFPCPECKGEQA